MNNLSHLTPVYIDETGFETYFHRKYGRSLKGQLIKGKSLEEDTSGYL
ncbi:hypothetical protein SSU98_0610 [Streptococcus suis 98HAH33]|nr:hypothetical protein SSU98_0610 [Streptococcus suis 98HAH33]